MGISHMLVVERGTWASPAEKTRSLVAASPMQHDLGGHRNPRFQWVNVQKRPPKAQQVIESIQFFEV
jgi:hypothetical protein